MLGKIEKIFIFAFVIVPVLHFGKVIASTSPSPRTSVEPQINLTPAPTVVLKVATTTTLASSNAPATTATTTIDATSSTPSLTSLQNGHFNGAEEIDADDNAIATTMLPEFSEKISQKFEDIFTTSTIMAATATTTSPTARISASVINEKEGRKSSIGNGVKTEMKNEEKNVDQKGIRLQVVENFRRDTDEEETTTIVNTNLEVKRKSKELQGLAADETMQRTVSSMPVTTATTPGNVAVSHNHVQLERKLKNGLYRIKLAEIVTDEFGGLPDEINGAAKRLGDAKIQNEKYKSIKKYYGGTDTVNIADLYPMKKEEFDPIIRNSNMKLLEERTIFKKPVNEAEYRQNLLPNEVEVLQQQQQQYQPSGSDTTKPRPRQLPTLEMTLMNHDGDTISDFTGKLLAEQDGVITEIEQKFRLDEFGATETNKTSITSQAAKSKRTNEADGDTTLVTPNTPTLSVKPTISRSQQLLGSRGKGHHFIDRRVKKSFAFPMHRAASDVMSEPFVDFANTKFTGGNSANGNPAANTKTFTADSTTNGGAAPSSGVVVAGAAHPEFSTTKFYNSKELYNEMIMHNRLKQLQNKSGTTTSTITDAEIKQPHTSGSIEATTTTTTTLPGAASQFTVLKNTLAPPTVSGHPSSSTSLPPLRFSSPADIVAKPTELINANHASVVNVSPATSGTTQHSEPSIGLEITAAENGKQKKFQKELKRAKLLLKAIRPTTYSPTSTSTISATVALTPINTSPMPSSTAQPVTFSQLGRNDGTPSPPMIASSTSNGLTTATTAVTSTSGTTTKQHAVTNPTKSASKPIARPRILTSLQEKINSLECEIQNVPQDSHLWRGNETHELLLPIITPAQCANAENEQGKREKIQPDCLTTPVSVSWDGESEIQSGDILIVEINDASLLKNKSTPHSGHFTLVYQVTRSGHEHCDVTEGILLDITPLVVDGRKLVTLYDKDLTEGVNLLIVVSELWGSQCIRLKVTTKTDNCGENADCSGKGVCYSNQAMEEYECQCCSGFAGPHCEEIDACTPSPCTNNGICVDLSQGHEGNSYQCLCPYGYTGKNCQYESDPCNPAECMNGGSCIGNSTHFRCDCMPGYAGPLCQHSLNECESSPCVHGICVDQEDGFRCFCQPGFAGELCNFEYNECESNPCQNGGECIDHIGSFECRCTKGYKGNRCQIKVDFCANKPCPEGHHCIDHGNDFSCECPGGRNGLDCNQMARTQCTVNPCTNGGTCWTSGDSFYCACRPGFTGTMCEDEFVVETVVSSSEFIVDDVNARNLNDKTFASSVVLKSPIELHNAYFAAGVLAAAFFIVAVVVTICHCKVNQTYRKFSTRSTSFIPIIGFGRRPKPQSKLNKHWLSGKGLGSGNSLRSTTSSRGHLTSNGTALHHSHHHQYHQQQQQQQQQQQTSVGQLQERPFQRHLAMNLENDMYYTVDFSENSQHSPLIQ